MKPSIPFRLHDRPSHSGKSAFTLPELMVSVAIFILLVGGMLSANLFGLRMFQFEQTRLIASDQARKIVGVLANEIHECQSFQIGTFTNGTFTGLALGAPQIGPALIVYPTTNAANYIMYFVNTADQKFRRATSVPGSTRIVAQSVTNASDLFRAQDYLGNVLTNMQNNTVLHLKLEFYQATRFGVPPDYYKLETSATVRQPL